ncbi:MAG: 4Fe-4S binding protein [Candidatus Hodarchaeales archaeon]|jgi:polyferredoxin
MTWHKKDKVNMTKLRLLRIFVQFIMFLLMNLSFFLIGATWLVLPVVMPKSIFTTSEGAFDLLQRMLTTAIIPLVPLALFFIIGAVFGRMFCSWGCPFGLFQDIIGFLTSKINKYEPTKDSNDSYRQIGEFITGGTVLVAVVIGIGVGLGDAEQIRASFGVFSEQPWTALSPATFLFTVIPLLFYWGGIESFFNLNTLGQIDIFFWIRFIIFAGGLILIIYVPRGWCRWFCPVGIIMGQIGKNSMIGVGRNITKCTHCGICEDVCPMGVRILSHPPEKVRSEHCTLCLDCVAACPDDAMEIKYL